MKVAAIEYSASSFAGSFSIENQNICRYTSCIHVPAFISLEKYKILIPGSIHTYFDHCSSYTYINQKRRSSRGLVKDQYGVGWMGWMGWVWVWVCMLLPDYVCKTNETSNKNFKFLTIFRTLSVKTMSNKLKQWLLTRLNISMTNVKW